MMTVPDLSGIMESPSIGLPCVDVGDRQRGRTAAPNILRVEADTAAIRSAVAKATTAEFRSSLKGMQNPYGDGRAAERIVEVLINAPDRQTLLRKRALPVGSGGFLS